MSSHREAPEISKDPVADSTDLYAFVSPDNVETVTIIANYIPLEDPAGGPNFFRFGDDVLYSGTVAAAVEGRFLGLPAMAVSLVMQPGSGQNFATAARVAAELVLRIQRSPLHQATILNVNVPDIPFDALQGYEVTRLGHRHRSEPMIRATDPRGRPVYWVGPAGEGQDAGPGTDFHAVANGCVSITPLQVDLTRYSMLDDLRDWLQGRDA